MEEIGYHDDSLYRIDKELGPGLTKDMERLDIKDYEELWDFIDVQVGPGILPAIGEDHARNTDDSAFPFLSHDTDCYYIMKALFHGKPSTKILPVTQSLILELVRDSLTNVTNIKNQESSIFHGRRVTALLDGRLALVPTATHPGDIICCLAGSQVPYVLRPLPDHADYFKYGAEELEMAIQQVF